MKDLITSIFGAYVPVTSVVPVDVDGSVQMAEVIVDGLAGVDWPWIAGVLLFTVVLWSFFRLVGVLLK